ncbi:unnamed protein product [Camellia sinensis]
MIVTLSVEFLPLLQMDPHKYRPSSAYNSPCFTTNFGAPVWNNNSSLTVGTRGGNFDLVGNNFPVFFIRDGMKFPDMVHALKPNPKSHIQENWRIVDFFSHHPESLHMFSLLFDDVGVPQDYRHMEGSGVNTYTLINKAGRSNQIGGSNHSHATQDLYDSIAAGNYPEWKLFIQTIDPDHEDRFDFDPLDVTKTWPEDILPLQPVGRLVLNKNIDNFFAENEQLAFCPAIIVPGIYYSDDKLLQTRIFSYSDTQRHRLGPNYLQLPANAPKCAHHNNHHEGFMNFMHRDEELSTTSLSSYDSVRHAETFPIPPTICTGKRDKNGRKTTLSSLVRDTDHLHQTGRSALSADGSKLCLTRGSLMRYAVFGSHTGLRQVSGSEAGLSPQHEAKHLKVKPPQDDFSEC